MDITLSKRLKTFEDPELAFGSESNLVKVLEPEVKSVCGEIKSYYQKIEEQFKNYEESMKKEYMSRLRGI